MTSPVHKKMREDHDQKNQQSKSDIDVLAHVIVVNHTTLIDLADICINNDACTQENARGPQLKKRSTIKKCHQHPYNLDLADLTDFHINNDVARAQDLSDNGTTDGGRDDDDVHGTDAIGKQDQGAEGGGGGGSEQADGGQADRPNLSDGDL